MFIDEIHTLVGAGKAEGSADLANIFKPALSRGGLTVIGATTFDEYRSSIEKDPALDRRFAPVYVNAATEAETLDILRSLKPKLERHHNIRIADAALETAISFATRYYPTALPDSAITVLSGAASAYELRLHADEPTALTTQRTKMKTLRQAVEQLSSDPEPENVAGKLARTQQDLQAAERELQRLEREWSSLSEAEQVSEQEESAASLNLQLQALTEELAQAGQVRKLEIYPEIAEIHSKLEALTGEEEDQTSSSDLSVEPYLNRESVARFVSKEIGTPVASLTQSEADRLLNFEKNIAGRIIGQRRAAEAVGNALRRAKSGLKANSTKPIGTFIFAGPTGTGKTEFAKALAAQEFGDADALTTIDLSEYMQKGSESRLIGAAPGFVGYEKGGTLTEAVRKKPYQVVLLDEADKATPEVLNLLLQIAEEGKLTDGQGRTVSFRNTIVIVTTNYGAEKIVQLSALPDVNEAHMRAVARAEIESKIKPEILNRMTDIIIFTPLAKEEIEQIAQLGINKIRKVLADHPKKLGLEASEAAISKLAELGYNPELGARPMGRVLETMIEDEIAKELLRGTYVEGVTIYVDYNAEVGKFTFSTRASSMEVK